MSSDQDNSVDLEKEVSVLSTRLLEAIDKQVDLGDQVKVLKRELDISRREKMSLEDSINNGSYLEKSIVDEEKRLRAEAESEATKLRAETIELTDRLFDEANTMVADAKRETAEIQKRNDQLQAQIEEKNTLLDAMQAQSVDLKRVLQEVSETRTATSTPGNRISAQILRSSSGYSVGASSALANGHGSARSSIDSMQPETLDDMNDEILFSPLRPILRYDLHHHAEFLQLIQASSAVTGSPHLDRVPSNEKEGTASPRFHFLNGSSLKEFKFFKRALADDIEPTLRLDQAPGISWLARRNVMSAIMDGTVIIEPIASINERGLHAYKEREAGSSTSLGSGQGAVATSGDANGGEERPIATLSSCAFCGESRNTHLIYARLHNLRAGPDKTERSSSGMPSISTASLLHRTSNNNNSTTTGQTDLTSSSSTDSVGSGTSTSRSVSAGSATPTNSSSDRSSPLVSAGYPMCHYCLSRVRAVCDFIGFVRSVRDGVWRVTDPESEKKAWNECFRLRERMFFARSGGRFVLDVHAETTVEYTELHINDKVGLDSDRVLTAETPGSIILESEFFPKSGLGPTATGGEEPYKAETTNPRSEVRSPPQVGHEPDGGEQASAGPARSEHGEKGTGHESDDDEDEFLDSYADQYDDVVQDIVEVEILKPQQAKDVDGASVGGEQ